MSSHHRPSTATHPPLNPLAYEQETYARGLRYSRPPFTFDSTQWEPLALARLSADAKGYVHGSAGHRETYDKNLAAFRKWSIVPSRLVKTNGFTDLRTQVFGEDKKNGKGEWEQRLNWPIAIAPVGVMRIFHPEGEEGAARAARREGVPFILSTASSTSIEDVAVANDGVEEEGGYGGDDEDDDGSEHEGGVRWYQLYWPSREHDDITISLLDRAKKAGYTALFVTLDTYILGWRPSDMDNGYNPFLKADNIGVELGFTDPVFRKHFKDKHGKEIEEDKSAAAAEWTRTVFPGFSHGWEDIKFLQEHWHGPIVLKGIQTIADAKKAAEVGVQGIVVSNHGGRQQDGGVGSLSMLPKIADAVGDKLDLFFDSGVRCGADIAKALALGAKCCLIGRPYVYGLALGGEEGVSHVLKALIGDLDLTLHLSGVPSLATDVLNRDLLVREDDI